MTTEENFRILYIVIFFLSVAGWGLLVVISGNYHGEKLVGQVSDAVGAITGTALVAILAIEGVVRMLARDAIKSANERREAAEQSREAAERERVEDKERYEALLREKDSEIAELRAEIEHRNNGYASNGGQG